jgi:hypothetical protein
VTYDMEAVSSTPTKRTLKCIHSSCLSPDTVLWRMSNLLNKLFDSIVQAIHQCSSGLQVPVLQMADTV